jgi:hypothetical protein
MDSTLFLFGEALFFRCLPLDFFRQKYKIIKIRYQQIESSGFPLFSAMRYAPCLPAAGRRYAVLG